MEKVRKLFHDTPQSGPESHQFFKHILKKGMVCFKSYERVVDGRFYILENKVGSPRKPGPSDNVTVEIVPAELEDQQYSQDVTDVVQPVL